MQIILASQSPRRRDYMTKLLGEDGFLAVVSDIPEPFDDTLSLTENAEQLALAKARHIQQQFPYGLIIASDTIVEVDGRLLAKAETREEAEAMLRSQFGKTTQVVSALAVLSPKGHIVTHDTTEVVFKHNDDPGVDAALSNWVQGEKWRGLAGAYAIQSEASQLIQSIRGDISNVIGFPVRKLRLLLRDEFGIETNEVDDMVPRGIEQRGESDIISTNYERKEP